MSKILSINGQIISSSIESTKYYKRKHKKSKKKKHKKTKEWSFLKEHSIKIGSVNPRISGVWKAKRLCKTKKDIKDIIANNDNYLENRQLLKAYSTLITPKMIKGYKKKRLSNVSKLKEPTKCVVCKKRPAYCNHHIQLLINGGGNEESNLIPICYDCHKKVHDWLQ